MTDSDDIVKYAKLLYRSGAWMSFMDDAGGKDAEILERDALRETLRSFLNEKDYQSIISIIECVLSHQITWKKWAENLGDFMGEVSAEASSLPLPLRQCIHELAYRVATRFRERNIVSAAINGMAGSLTKFLAPSREMKLKPSVNISVSEKHALNELAEVLNLTHRML